MSDDEWGFDDAIEQEASFLLQDEFLPPEPEEPFLVESTDVPALPIMPADANPAESEAQAATDEPLHTAVLPHIEDVTVSSSPCVRRVRLRCKTTPPTRQPLQRRAYTWQRRQRGRFRGEGRLVLVA